jgi:membrane-associated phospholipid phosphatase
MKSKFIFFLLPLFLSANFLHSQNVDIHWLRCINETEHPQLDKTMKFTSNSVTPMMIAVPVGLFAYEYFRKDGDIRKPAVIGVSLATTAVITFGLKYSVNRPRPFVTYPDIIKRGTAGSKSFPSGHTSSAFALATSVSLCYPKWYVIAPVYAWALAVGYSRMRLGVHYPSDVIVGAIIGAGCAWASYEMNNYLLKQQ